MLEREIYLDNSATTKVYPEVIREMVRIMDEEYGNPSSLHRRGTGAERILLVARQQLATTLGVKSKEIIFTSGGTEANNLAVLGLGRRLKRRGRHAITSAIEHSSVLEPFRQLEEEGFSVTYVQPDNNGLLQPGAVAAALTPETTLVSIMHVNNEIGSIQPLSLLAGIIRARAPQAVFHVDAVQSFSRLPLSPMDLNIDALSISAHKFHGPKGAGLLYLREGLLIEPLLRGGGQESGLRAGTENTPALAGMALAAGLSIQDFQGKNSKLYQLKNKLLAALQGGHPWLNVNGAGGKEGAPHILNISYPGLQGEVILHALEERGIYVSTGSACHSRKKAQSHVLQAMGLEQKRIAGAVRISLSHLNTAEEIELAANSINQVVEELKWLL